MKRSYLSIGFSLIFISQLLEVVLRFIVYIIMKNSVIGIETIIIIANTLMMLVGLFIAKKEFDGIKRAIPILIVQIIANICLFLIGTYGGMEGDGAISAIKIIFDSVTTLTIVAIIKDAYVDKEMPIKFIKIVSIIIVINTLMGLFATLWSKALSVGAEASMLAAVLLLSLALITEIASYILFLIVVGRAIKAFSVKKAGD